MAIRLSDAACLLPPSTRADSRFGFDTHSARLIELVAKADIGSLDPAAINALRIFLADTLAVGIAGKCNPAADGVLAAMQAVGGAGHVGCLGRPDIALPAHQAAVINGFQIHCLEWDGLHEPSVVIALCATIAALHADLASSDATYGDLLLAFAVGVETAVFFGSAAATAPRFFRPSAAGTMGAAMAVGKLRGYDREQLHNVLGLAYSQVGGTMQAHWEGSEALALQVGFAARAALTAADLVAHGITGPHEVVSGKFGYFTLIEQPEDLDGALAQWGSPWKITEMAHKPFPAGRATQAVLTALLELRAERDFDAEDVALVRAEVPSLIGLLVSRPWSPKMSPAYARLCLEYIVARMLLDRTIDPVRFTDAFIGEDDVAALAQRIECVVDDNPDPNALGPQTVTVTLKDGTKMQRFVDAPLGAPGHPLSAAQRIDKIARCFAAGGWKGDPAQFMAAFESAPLDQKARELVLAQTGGSA
ncbi:MmgE/PrpD family protein [Altererythrobacter sp. BO-6]|uniref:MmgE/PrpD family protein n=1 Tax=Altererythrobacter sp. BO-6 TaxID=2604537 RepID=UPI0013E1E2D5|nr:MmgE/PrpD family protein [Altererythrobacter sp. BO-6]QIG53603.1 MmgE/PrpD family protein [Altererythrobacter sp. BO-6]